MHAAYGFPIRDPGGDAVGVCAVLDRRPRPWTAAELPAARIGASGGTRWSSSASVTARAPACGLLALTISGKRQVNARIAHACQKRFTRRR
ncbi:hypothetical protein ABT369_22465 [Dactylosporangium sp. NPDC000244]|uniref:hypothetical protein n=1 Tax=Dactylosporangium sp. NPDC000244 TaxID=3154365 RepID=UPI003328EA48